MKVAIYARVSTEDQNVDQQAKFTREWFEKNGHEIIKTVKDKESGRLPLTERKKFLKLLESSLDNGTEAIGIYNLDRLTRNWDDVTYIERYFRENMDRIRLLSTSDAIDMSNASGRFMFRVKMATNCLMPEDMREKQAIGIARAKKQGKYKGGTKGRTWKRKN